MTADSQWALQQIVYSTLRADTTLQSLTGATPARIFDHVPQNSWNDEDPNGNPLPYVVVGDSTATDSDTKTEDGMEQTLTIHTWSRYLGMSQVKRIMGAVVDALDHQALTVTGHDLIQIDFEFSDTFLDPDGVTRHGVQRFRAVTEAT